MGDFAAANLGTATRKTIFLIAAALFAIWMLNLAFSLAFVASARSAELTTPRQLQPRFDIESKSAPSRGRRVHSPQLISSMTIGQCGHLTSPRDRQECMVRASGGPWSYVPSATINGGMPVAVVVSGESK
jgi:hypothetical protein